MKLWLPFSYSILLRALDASAVQSDVIIVGAGPAGMSTAKTLLERDPTTTITILEATDRIGGRVRTTQLGADGNNPVHVALVAEYPDI